MTERASAAILAAGSSQRLGEDKTLADLGGRPVVLWSIAAAQAARVFDEIVVVAAPRRIAAVEAVVGARHPAVRVVAGGDTRTASSWAALEATRGDVLALHDAARPFVSASLFARAVEVARRDGAAVAGLPLADTVRRADEVGASLEELEREGLWQVQTPQAFRRDVLEHAREAAGDRSFTDDGAAVVASGARIRMVPGERRNLKITTSEDLAYARELVTKGLVAMAATARDRPALAAPDRPAAPDRSLASQEAITHSRFRSGLGYDIHRLAPDRRLVLGGVAIEHPTGLLGHSDGDVLCHAVMDALLGAGGLGDLGTHFPSDDPGLAGASSLGLLRRVAALLRDAGLVVASVDATVIAAAPRLAPHVAAMRTKVAEAIGTAPGRVSVKATTNDGFGAVGAEQAIAAIATALVEER
ncbi:MAG: 2-C-methyl-D-erythritol 4-phosphate cytidylyltransferase [Chloroflexota bacterium]|nr:2-C-methyl-D-erythritol 4-phosphate cytidylyltransferase [Chloroflexota bacterium]